MFFISDDKTDNNIDVYKILEEESSKHLTVKQKPTQIKILPNIEKNNSIYNNNKAFNIKVKPKLNNIKSQEWHHS